MSFILSILVKMLLMLVSTWSYEPKTPPMLDKMLLNFSFNVNILFNPFYNMLGKFKNLKVCPVGAVSNTITSNYIFSIELYISQKKYLINWENDIASSIPGTELKISFNKVCVLWSSEKLNMSYYFINWISTFGSIYFCLWNFLPLRKDFQCH